MVLSTVSILQNWSDKYKILFNPFHFTGNSYDINLQSNQTNQPAIKNIARVIRNVHPSHSPVQTVYVGSWLTSNICSRLCY